MKAVPIIGKWTQRPCTQEPHRALHGITLGNSMPECGIMRPSSIAPGSPGFSNPRSIVYAGYRHIPSSHTGGSACMHIWTPSL